MLPVTPEQTRPSPDRGRRPRRRLAVLAVVAWMLVVVTGSSVVWSVVRRAGDEVVAATPDAPRSATSTPSATGSTGARPEEATWSGTPGSVTVVCRGERIRLIRAIPSPDGYAVEVEEDGPSRVRLHFEGREEHDGDEIELAAVCEDARPRFRTGPETD